MNKPPRKGVITGLRLPDPNLYAFNTSLLIWQLKTSAQRAYCKKRRKLNKISRNSRRINRA